MGVWLPDLYIYAYIYIYPYYLNMYIHGEQRFDLVYVVVFLQTSTPWIYLCINTYNLIYI